jgi:hypothetical protein
MNHVSGLIFSQRLTNRAQISHTRFMRTQREHHETVESVWVCPPFHRIEDMLNPPQRQLDDQGLIYKSSYSGWYSITDECFYTDAQVTTAPNTTSNSGSTISLETGSPVEWHSEENYMLRLSVFQPSFLEDISPTTPSRCRANPLFRSPGGLIHLAAPSRLVWGVPVPGDPEQTVYVVRRAVGVSLWNRVPMAGRYGDKVWVACEPPSHRQGYPSVSSVMHLLSVHAVERDTDSTPYTSPQSCLLSVCRCKNGFWHMHIGRLNRRRCPSRLGTSLTRSRL